MKVAGGLFPVVLFENNEQPGSRMITDKVEILAFIIAPRHFPHNLARLRRRTLFAHCTD
jgi:hypothetical protein